MKKKNFFSVSLLGALLLVAFMFVGMGTVQAQKNISLVSTSQALDVLTVEIGDLLAAKENAPQEAGLENFAEAAKILYYKGIATRLKEGMSTVDALLSNHDAFIAKLSPQYQGAANALKSSAEGLLD